MLKNKWKIDNLNELISYSLRTSGFVHNVHVPSRWNGCVQSPTLATICQNYLRVCQQLCFMNSNLNCVTGIREDVKMNCKMLCLNFKANACKF